MSLFPVVILAGGLGMRLRPYTHFLPKSLILIQGKPFIDYQLRLLKQQNIEQVLLIIGYLGEYIQDYLGDGSRYGLTIHYYHEGDKAMGTAGCLEAAFMQLPEVFFLLYGDSYLPIDFQKVQQQFYDQNKSALMTIYKNNHPQHVNNVDFDGQTILAYHKALSLEKYSYIDYGLSIFTKTLFQNKAEKVRDLSEYFQKLIQIKDLGYYEALHPFYEIGSLEGINQFRDFIYE